MLSILKMLSFFLVAEALTGLIYHRPAGENFSFCVQFSFILNLPKVVHAQKSIFQKHCVSFLCLVYNVGSMVIWHFNVQKLGLDRTISSQKKPLRNDSHQNLISPQMM